MCLAQALTVALAARLRKTPIREFRPSPANDGLSIECRRFDEADRDVAALGE